MAGVAALAGGGYIAVNTLVDQKVAKIQEELKKQAADSEPTQSEAEDLSETTDGESTSVTDENTNAPAQVKTEPKPAEKKSEVKTFTTPSGAVIDEAGNVISGSTQQTSLEPPSNVVAGVKILSGEEIYSLVSPSVVFITWSDASYQYASSGFVINEKT